MKMSYLIIKYQEISLILGTRNHILWPLISSILNISNESKTEYLSFNQRMTLQAGSDETNITKICTVWFCPDFFLY